jgi:hypothetical protein
MDYSLLVGIHVSRADDKAEKNQHLKAPTPKKNKLRSISEDLEAKRPSPLEHEVDDNFELAERDFVPYV